MFLTGPQSTDAADWIFTADTNKEPNKLIYTCALNNNGGVESDLTVTVIDSGNGEVHTPSFDGKGYYIVTGGASGYYTFAHVQNGIKEKGFNASIEDVTDKIGVISIQGPRSRDILQKVTDLDLSNASFPPNTSKMLSIKAKDTIDVRALRLSFIGELGFELHIPSDKCVEVYNKLWEVGQPFGLGNVGYRSFYSMSCEKGYHLWGFDLRMDDSPIEANLGFTCRKSGNYKGKKAIEQQRLNGINKRLVYLTLDEKVPLFGLEGVYRNGMAVGHVRRSEYAYSLDKMVGKVFVKHPENEIVDAAFLKSGKYEVEVLGRKYNATCHLKSPFDPENKRILGEY